MQKKANWPIEELRILSELSLALYNRDIPDSMKALNLKNIRSNAELGEIENKLALILELLNLGLNDDG
jgi:hypothetical protein